MFILEETLLVITADHSHVFTLGGYQSRGNDIFTYTNKKSFLAKDKMRYTTLGYFNGPGAAIGTVRKEPSPDDLRNPDYKWLSMIPIKSETHGGEDVGKMRYINS